MQLAYNYNVSPGCCFSCRSATPGKIIDLNREDPASIKRNNVYLCSLCTTAAYKMLEPSQVLVESAKLAELEGEIVALTDEILRLRVERDAWDARIAQAVAANVDA